MVGDWGRDWRRQGLCFEGWQGVAEALVVLYAMIPDDGSGVGGNTSCTHVSALC